MPQLKGNPVLEIVEVKKTNEELEAEINRQKINLGVDGKPGIHTQQDLLDLKG